jgi:hypothetical protein
LQKGYTGYWYLFNDEKITKKQGDIATISKKENIHTQVTSLYYLKKEEVTMKKYAEKAQEKLVQEEDHRYDDVGTEESELSFVKDFAQIQKKGVRKPRQIKYQRRRRRRA